MAYKLLVLLCVVAAVVAQQCQPGTTVTSITTTTTTTTVSATDDEGTSSIVSAGERGLIRKTWKDAKKDGDVAPKILFRFIKNHPEYQLMFKRFAHVPQDELMGNGNFLAQAYTILAGLNVVIQSIGSQELLAQEITALGGAHFERGATPVMFEEFSAIVVEVLGEELGSSFTTEAKDAWINALRALSAGISRQLKKKEDLPHPITKLTPHQIYDVRRSWENIRTDRVAIVGNCFVKFFKDTPRRQRAFVKFANVPLDGLKNDAHFVKQSTLVADRLDNLIATMDDTLQVLGQINYLAFSHIPRDVGKAQFEDFATIFIDALKERGVSVDDIDSWRGILTTLIAGIDRVQKQA